MESPERTLVITGPGGVGKTTVAFEVSRKLEEAGIAHALIDTDELDRIYPSPPEDPNKSVLTMRNLRAVWKNLNEAGARSLILTSVMVSLERELSSVRRAIGEKDTTVFRLLAPEDELLERVRRREVGDGMEDQALRSVEQLRAMESESLDLQVVTLRTGGSFVDEVASEVLARSGWLRR